MISEETYQFYQSHLLKGSRAACSEIVRNLLNSDIAIKEIYVELFQRSMYEVGTEWEHNRISVATEHMCTAITESLISICYPAIFSADHIGKKAVITCTPGEFHQIGARMVADYFELYGWDGYFLGSDTPAEELMKFIEENQPDLLAVSLSVYFNLPALVNLVKGIRSHFPGLTIITGGQGFRWGGREVIDSMDNVHLIVSLEALERSFLNLNPNEI